MIDDPNSPKRKYPNSRFGNLSPKKNKSKFYVRSTCLHNDILNVEENPSSIMGEGAYGVARKGNFVKNGAHITGVIKLVLKDKGNYENLNEVKIALEAQRVVPDYVIQTYILERCDILNSIILPDNVNTTTDLLLIGMERGINTVEDEIFRGLSVDNLKQIIKKSLKACYEFNCAGFFHRDIKPNNMVVVERKGKQEAVLIDFGATVYMSHVYDYSTGIYNQYTTNPPFDAMYLGLFFLKNVNMFQINNDNEFLIIENYILKKLHRYYDILMQLEPKFALINKRYFNSYSLQSTLKKLLAIFKKFRNIPDEIKKIYLEKHSKRVEFYRSKFNNSIIRNFTHDEEGFQILKILSKSEERREEERIEEERREEERREEERREAYKQQRREEERRKQEHQLQIDEEERIEELLSVQRNEREREPEQDEEPVPVAKNRLNLFTNMWDIPNNDCTRYNGRPRLRNPVGNRCRIITKSKEKANGFELFHNKIKKWINRKNHLTTEIMQRINRKLPNLNEADKIYIFKIFLMAVDDKSTDDEFRVNFFEQVNTRNFNNLPNQDVVEEYFRTHYTAEKLYNPTSSKKECKETNGERKIKGLHSKRCVLAYRNAKRTAFEDYADHLIKNLENITPKNIFFNKIHEQTLIILSDRYFSDDLEGSIDGDEGSIAIDDDDSGDGNGSSGGDSGGGGGDSGGDSGGEPRYHYLPVYIPDHQHIDRYLNDLPSNCRPDRRSISGNGEEYDYYIKPYVSKLCDVLPLNNVDNIFGPSEYNEYLYNPTVHGLHNPNNIVRKIGIFGEFHKMLNEPNILDKYNSRTTLTINSFLKSLLLSNSRKVYDLYLETEFISKSRSTRKRVAEINFSLHLLNYEFEKCFQIDKSLCAYRNLRAHYIDYRNNIIIIDILTFIEAYQDKNNQKKLEIIDNLHKYIIELPKIKKQLINNDMSKKIKDFLLKKIYETMLQTYDKAWDTDYLKYYNVTALQMFVINLVMDAYVLGRLFKQQSMSIQENIIIYAGNAHTIVYREFLEYIGCVKVLNIPVAYHYNEKKKRVPTQIIRFKEVDKKKSFLFN